MKVSKLNEAKLNEIRYKKYVEELKDFCRYGYCLEEETAKEYLKFLVDGITKIAKKHKTITKDTAHKINNNRFEKELERRPKNKDDYFESEEENREGTLKEFEIDFREMFNQLKLEKDDKGNRKIKQDWITWIQTTFNDYVSRFDQRDPAIPADFAKKVNWKDKGESTGEHMPSSVRD